jgi:AraC-like DNA-binding protein
VTDAGPLRVALLPAVRRHVEDNLGDPDLSPAAIAAAHAISLRTLHAMFAPTGESVGAFIRRRRLERSRADLLAHPRRPITDIALRWGFASPSAFTRAFRAWFDLTPSRLRADPEG